MGTAPLLANGLPENSAGRCSPRARLGQFGVAAPTMSTKMPVAVGKACTLSGMAASISQLITNCVGKAGLPFSSGSSG